jgi:hypothetical protein
MNEKNISGKLIAEDRKYSQRLMNGNAEKV